MKKIILLYIFLVVVVIGLAVVKFTGVMNLFPQGSSSSKAEAIIKNSTIKLAVAKTDQEKQKGLSGRKKLDPDQGMLFIFDQKGRHQFWMKDMQFGIDIIFLEKKSNDGITAGTVVDIIENAKAPAKDAPPSALEIYEPQKEADLVLEVNEGFSKNNELHIGDTISFKGVK